MGNRQVLVLKVPVVARTHRKIERNVAGGLTYADAGNRHRISGQIGKALPLCGKINENPCLHHFSTEQGRSRRLNDALSPLPLQHVSLHDTDSPLRLGKKWAPRQPSTLHYGRICRGHFLYIQSESLKPDKGLTCLRGLVLGARLFERQTQVGIQISRQNGRQSIDSDTQVESPPLPVIYSCDRQRWPKLDWI